LRGLDGLDSRVGISKSATGDTSIKIDGTAATSASQLAMLAPLQIIEPSSIDLIEDGSKIRRQFLDWGVFHVEHQFLKAWSKVQKVLKQRNALLKLPGTTPYLLAPWDEQLIDLAGKIDVYRSTYLDDFRVEFARVVDYLELSFPVEITFSRGWARDKTLSQCLSDSSHKDLERGYTFYGPHRADLDLKSGGISAKEHLSRGQKKMLVIALKLAVIETLFKKTGKKAILLIDDIGAELDSKNRKRLIRFLSDFENQVFVTAIDEETVGEYIDLLNTPKLSLVQVSGAVEKKQTMPVLSNVLLAVDGNTLSITGTDLEVELVAKLKLEESFEKAEITVPAKKFVDICKALPDDAIINVTLDEQKLIVKSGRSRFTLSTLPAGEYPNLEESEGDLSFVIKQEKLRKLIDATSFAVAQQDVRYYLNGMLFDLSAGELCVVATDGHRMALAKGAADIEISERLQIIVPRKGIAELGRLLSEPENDISITVSKNHIRVTTPEMVFTSKLIDGKFPDYNRVLPKGGDKVMVGERNQVKQAFSRVAILSNEKYRGVRAEFDQGSLKILANNPDQEEAEEQVEVDYQDDYLEIGFNVSYVIDVLNVIKGDMVRFTLSDSNSSALVDDVNDPSAMYVIMPMRL
jgi:DNA polymerase-3 subunit beta